MIERRRLLSVSGGLAATALAGCTDILGGEDVPFDGDPTEWPQTLHDPGNTGRNPAASGPRDGLEREWVYEPDPDIEGFFESYSAPIVREGDVYIAERWRMRTDDEHADHAYLVALDESGEPRWTEELGVESGVPLTKFGLLVHGDDVVTVSAFTPSGRIAGPGGTTLFEGSRYDPATGEHSETFELDELAGPTTLADERLYAFDSGGVMTVDPADGVVDERFAYEPTDDELVAPFGDSVGYPPTVVEGTVYAAATSRLVAAEPGTDEPEWVLDVDDVPELVGADMAGTFFQPAVGTDRLYAVYGVWNAPWMESDTPESDPEVLGGVVTVDRESGEVEWTWQPDVEDDWAGTFGCSPVVDGDRIYVTGYHGLNAGDEPDQRLYALDAEGSGQVWDRSIAEQAYAPVASNETVYVATPNEVVAIDASSGDRLARDTLEEYSPDPEVPPAVVDGRLVVATQSAVIAYGE